MSKYDQLYGHLVLDIIEYGTWDKDQDVRPKWADGTPAYTKSIISHKMVFDNSEVPILTTKRVAWKTAIHELLWFYVHRTSDVSYLRKNDVKIWEEWTRKDNTIGKAYGYQLGKKIFDNQYRYETVFLRDSSGYGYTRDYAKEKFTNQVHKLINGLKNDPASRRHIITLLNYDDAWDMALFPCVWHSQWLVKEGKLHLIVGIRSNDVALGQPFNVFQYYVLQRMIAQVTGYAMGTLTFNINDAHLYERHIEPVHQQILLPLYEAPKLWINQYIKDFDDFSIDDFILVNPKLSDFDVQDMSREDALSNAWYEHNPTIKMEVSI